MKNLLIALFLSLTLATGAAHAEADKKSPLTEQQAVQLLQEGKPLYSCAMHEHVFSDKEGKCPVCGMNMAQASGIEGGKAVFKESKDSKNMDMKNMKMMEKK